jgi:hypothetical protein
MAKGSDAGSRGSARPRVSLRVKLLKREAAFRENVRNVHGDHLSYAGPGRGVAGDDAASEDVLPRPLHDLFDLGDGEI